MHTVMHTHLYTYPCPRVSPHIFKHVYICHRYLSISKTKLLPVFICPSHFGLLSSLEENVLVSLFTKSGEPWDGNHPSWTDWHSILYAIKVRALSVCASTESRPLYWEGLCPMNWSTMAEELDLHSFHKGSQTWESEFIYISRTSHQWSK